MTQLRTRGRLIVFEGPEGAGKSTQLGRLASWLGARGRMPRVVREPGTSAVGQEIRRVLLDPVHDIAYLCGNPNMVDEAFALLKEAGLSVPHIRREKYVSSR